MTISPPESGEKNKKVLEDPVKADPWRIDFAKLDKPGFWSSKISKGPKTTTWIWNLHADAHDFDVHTGDAEEATRKIFSAHLDILQSFSYGWVLLFSMEQDFLIIQVG